MAYHTKTIIATLTTLLLTALLLTLAPSPITACTAFIAGRNATAKGYTINTHTDDCYDCDFRIVQIPSQTNLLGHLGSSTSSPGRPVQPQSFSYPRYVGEGRGSVFYQEYLDQTIFNWTTTIPMSHIPLSNTTFSYIEGSYAISNEHGVALGESTCGGRWVAAPLFAGGKALFEIGELGKIALERSRTAREAIILMGDLAVKYGYYTAEWGPGDQQEGGEAYTVTDPFEAWVFHVSPTPSGDSAVWVAQRVPDNHAAVVTNSFIIRQVPFPYELDQNTFLYSKNIFDIAIENNLWDPNTGDRLDFKRVYGCPMPIYREPYVSRRQWRVLSTLTPSLNLQPTLTSFELPFSVKPDELITLPQVIALHRDHFEGTPFDTTVGIEAGPYGNPNRWDQYDGVDDDSITSILQALYNKDQKDVIIASSVGQEELMVPNFLPHQVSAKLAGDEDLFKQFAFAKSLNFSHFHYSPETIHEYNTIIQSLSESSSELLKSKSALPNGDILNIDRSQGEPLSDNTLSKGFFERTISLFRTSYSHITTLSPSFSSQYYPNTTFISQDPVFVPSYITAPLSTNGFQQPAQQQAQQKEVYKKNKNTIPASFTTTLPSSQTYSHSLTPRTLAFISYISLHQPASSTYTPVFPALPTQLNNEWTKGSLWKYTQDSAWWKFATVSNYANTAYRFIIRDINYTQQQHEAMVFERIEGLVEQYQECLIEAKRDEMLISTTTISNLLTTTNTTNPLSPSESMNPVSIINNDNIQTFDDLIITKDLLSLLQQSEDSLLQQMSSFYNDTRGTSSYTPFDSTLITNTTNNNNNNNNNKHNDSIKQCLFQTTTQTHSTSFSLSTQVLSTWKDLFHHILGRYHDGYRSDSPGAPVYTATPLFYPTFWLKLVRFWRLSLGDPAAGRGYEYLSGQSTGLFAINTTTSRRERYYEIDQQFNPGQQCLSPRLYDGTGDPEIIANSYTDRLLLNNGYNLLRTSVNSVVGQGDNRSAVNGGGNNSDNNTNIQQTNPILVSTPSSGTDSVNIYDFYNKDNGKRIGINGQGQQGHNNTTSPTTSASTTTPSQTTIPQQQQGSTQQPQQSHQYQSSLDGITDVIALYIIFTIVAAGLILIGYQIGRSSVKHQLEQSKQHVRALQYIMQSNGANINGMGFDNNSLLNNLNNGTSPQTKPNAQTTATSYIYDTYQTSNGSINGGVVVNPVQGTNGTNGGPTPHFGAITQPSNINNNNNNNNGGNILPSTTSSVHYQQTQNQKQQPHDSQSLWNEQQQMYMQQFHGASPPFYTFYPPKPNNNNNNNNNPQMNQQQQYYGSMNHNQANNNNNNNNHNNRGHNNNNPHNGYNHNNNNQHYHNNNNRLNNNNNNNDDIDTMGNGNNNAFNTNHLKNNHSYHHDQSSNHPNTTNHNTNNNSAHPTHGNHHHHHNNHHHHEQGGSKDNNGNSGNGGMNQTYLTMNRSQSLSSFNNIHGNNHHSGSGNNNNNNNHNNQPNTVNIAAAAVESNATPMNLPPTQLQLQQQQQQQHTNPFADLINMQPGNNDDNYVRKNNKGNKKSSKSPQTSPKSSVFDKKNHHNDDNSINNGDDEEGNNEENQPLLH